MKAGQLRFWRSLLFLKSQSEIIIVLILICDTSRLSSRYPNNIQGIPPKAIMERKAKRAVAHRQSKNEPSSLPPDAINSESDSASDCPPLGAISDAIPGFANMAEDTPPESPSEAPQVEACADEAPSDEAPAGEAPAEKVPVEEVPAEEVPAEEMPPDEDNRPETS